MCGRYTLFTEKEQRELYTIIKQVDDKLKRQGQPKLATGEIYPTNTAPVLFAESNRIIADSAVWGFPKPQSKGVIINARSETAAEKPMFATAFSTARCVVPSIGFYEWDKMKTKYLFKPSDEKLLFMGGLIRYFDATRRYIILTTNANESMQSVHSRMPVLLQKEEIVKWLVDYRFAMQILRRVPMGLAKEAVSDQITFG